MNAVVIYESLTGNTRWAGELIAAELVKRGMRAAAYATNGIDHQALSDADVVIVGAWTDGRVFFGQRPGRAARLRGLPVMAGKRCVVYCTYAVDPGKTLDKLTAIMRAREADVLGGMAIRRDRIEAGVIDLVDRVLGVVAA